MGKKNHNNVTALFILGKNDKDILGKTKQFF